MSNSKKKTPITGNTRSESEKDDKRRANRKMRRKMRCTNIDLSDCDLLTPIKEEYSDAWSFAKDGKRYIAGIGDYTKTMK